MINLLWQRALTTTYAILSDIKATFMITLPPFLPSSRWNMRGTGVVVFWFWKLGRSAPWLVGWLVSCSVSCTVGWLVGLLVGSLASPAGWLIFELACSNGLTVRLARIARSWAHRSTGWLAALLGVRLVSWSVGCVWLVYWSARFVCAALLVG